MGPTLGLHFHTYSWWPTGISSHPMPRRATFLECLGSRSTRIDKGSCSFKSSRMLLATKQVDINLHHIYRLCPSLFGIYSSQSTKQKWGQAYFYYLEKAFAVRLMCYKIVKYQIACWTCGLCAGFLLTFCWLAKVAIEHFTTSV